MKYEEITPTIAKKMDILKVSSRVSLRAGSGLSGFDILSMSISDKSFKVADAAYRNKIVNIGKTYNSLNVENANTPNKKHEAGITTLFTLVKLYQSFNRSPIPHPLKLWSVMIYKAYANILFRAKHYALEALAAQWGTADAARAFSA